MKKTKTTDLIAWQREFCDGDEMNLCVHRADYGTFDMTALVRRLVRASGFVEPTVESASLFLTANREEAEKIGRGIHDLGGFRLMQRAHDYLRDDFLTSLACRELEYAWDGIGEWLC